MMAIIGILIAVIILGIAGAAFANGFIKGLSGKPYKPKYMQTPQTIDWNAINDAELQSYLPDLKIQAIKRYRELTGVGLKDAKDAIDYVIDNPDGAKKGKKAGAVVDTGGAGVHDLIAEGRIEEAIDVYAAFMGVDEFTARDAIEQMQQAESAEANLSVESMDEVHRLVAEGKKIQAIKIYREISGLGLKEAKDEIDRIERENY